MFSAKLNQLSMAIVLVKDLPETRVPFKLVIVLLLYTYKDDGMMRRSLKSQLERYITQIDETKIVQDLRKNTYFHKI